MTNAEKFQICQRMAEKIVSQRRAEAPEGCDPQASYVALAGVAISAGTAAYASYSQKKDAEKAANAAKATGSAPMAGAKLKMPKFIPVNMEDLQNTALNYDKQAYDTSDADFKARHAPVVAAEKLFEAQNLKDQKGENELMPQIQNEFMRSGMAGSLSAFGDSTGTLTPGGAGEANVARNLGIDIMGFQDRNRANRQKSLMMAEDLFPRRTFGMTGQNAAQVSIANTAGQNQWNNADFADRRAVANAKQQQMNATASATAQANASASEAKTKMITSTGQAVSNGLSQYAGSQAQSPGASMTGSYAVNPAYTSQPNLYEGQMNGKPIYRGITV